MENLARQFKYTWFPTVRDLINPASQCHRFTNIIKTDPTESFQGRTVLITGSNTGLGLEAAKKFVTLHASKVIITSRSTEKGATAKALLEVRDPMIYFMAPFPFKKPVKCTFVEHSIMRSSGIISDPVPTPTTFRGHNSANFLPRRAETDPKNP
jgi:hypothetical protein